MDTDEKTTPEPTPAEVPAAGDKPEHITRAEWEEFRQEVREALAAGKTPPPAPTPEPEEEKTPTAPAPEKKEPTPEPEKAEEKKEPEPEQWGSSLFFRGRRRKEQG